MEILTMKAGVIEARNRAANILNTHERAVVLFSGLPATGKTTLTPVLGNTGFGGLVEQDEVIWTDEVGSGLFHGHHEISDILKGTSKRYNPRLFIAGVAGAKQIRDYVGNDPRLLVIGLYCDRKTRILNLLRRIPSNLFDKDENIDVFTHLKITLTSFQFNLNHGESTNTERYSPEVCDFMINTSLGSRISPKEIANALTIGA